MEVDEQPLTEPERLRVGAHLKAWSQRRRGPPPGQEVFDWLCTSAPPSEVRQQLLDLDGTWPADPPPVLEAALRGGQPPGRSSKAKRSGAVGRPGPGRPSA